MSNISSRLCAGLKMPYTVGYSVTVDRWVRGDTKNQEAWIASYFFNLAFFTRGIMELNLYNV